VLLAALAEGLPALGCVDVGKPNRQDLRLAAGSEGIAAGDDND
jgi:hypothetical protein